MNKEEKEVIGDQLDEEEKTLKELEKVYKKAREDVAERIAELEAREGFEPENLQTIIYQKRYQEALDHELTGILENLKNGSYTTINDYLQDSYINGYVGNAWLITTETGVPFLMPIDERKIVRALTVDSQLSRQYYQANPLLGRLAEDYELLKTRVRSNLSRGIASGMTWVQVASNIAQGMNNPFTVAMHDAMRIVRTEGHRVNQQGALDAGQEAVDHGADIVKQWDATLDGKTRPWHMEADGQIREWGQKFNVMGEELDAPAIGGSASNVINCRCQLMKRARWALDESELEELKKRAEFFGLDKTEQFEEYKKNFLKLPENADTVEVQSSYFHDVSSTTTKLKGAMSEQDYDAYMALVQSNPDIAPLYDKADYLRRVNITNDGGTFYTGANRIEFSYPSQSYVNAGMSRYSTIAHEYGHFFDTRQYDEITFDEFNRVRKATGRGYNAYGDASFSDQFLGALRRDAETIRSTLSDVKTFCREHLYTSTGVQDAIDGLGLGRIYWGHGDRYYNQFYNHHVKDSHGWFDHTAEMKQLYTDMGFDASNQAKVKRITRQYETASELWANITSAVTTGGEELESIKEFFPESLETFLEIIRKAK